MTERKRPPRTVGLAIAIVSSVGLFTILPLLQVAMVVIVYLRISGQVFAIPDGQGNAAQAFAVGGNFLGVEPARLIIQLVLALLFLVIALLAWRGRYPHIRIVYTAAVLVYTTIAILLAVVQRLTTPDPAQGFDSGQDVAQLLLSAQAGIALLIAIYIVWYVNRAPARAFFRGYYLEASREGVTPQDLPNDVPSQPGSLQT